MSTPRFRTAGPDDVEAVVALVESAYRGASSRQGWTTEAHLLDGQRTDAEAVAEIIASPRSRIVVAEVVDAGVAGEAELVGCCQLEARPDATAYLGLFAVAPRRQGAGLGRAIVGEAERVAGGAMGAERIVMTVIRQRTDLIAWYERLGYRPTGETRPFPYGDERFGRPRRPDLEFVVLSRTIDGDAASSADVEKM